MKIEKTSYLLLIAISLAAFMDGLDGSIVNVVLPVIAEAFSTDTGTISWIAMAYLLMVAGTILIFGNIAARGHIKKTFIIGFALFGGASAVCGISPTLGILIGARLVQGLGASMIIACAPIICVKFLPTRILGLSFGVLPAATSVGFAIGPAMGGFITHALSWHWIFLINVPIAVFAIIYVLKVIPRGTPDTVKKFDLRGALLLFVFMVAGIFTLERFPHLGFTSPQIIGAAALCIFAGLLFIIAEFRTESPLLNLRVFKKFRVSAVFIAYLIIQLIYSGLIYLPPFYLTNAMQMDTLTIGLYLLLPPVISAVLSVPFGKWSDSTGRRAFCVASCVFLCAACFIFGVIQPAWGILPLLATLFFMGMCISVESGPASSKCVEVMPAEERETGSTLVMTLVYGGAVAGTALFAAVFTLLTRSGGEVLSFADLPHDLFLSGYHLTMLIGGLISVVSLILMAVVRDAKSE